MDHEENKGHVPGEYEFETDPESCSNHYYRVCETCHATLWTCPRAYEGEEAHSKPEPCRPVALKATSNE